MKKMVVYILILFKLLKSQVANIKSQQHQFQYM
jgi:hypothetical protein